MNTLETQRLFLRGWHTEDLEDFYEYCKNPHVGPAAGWEPHQGIEVSRSILSSFIEKDEVWAIIEKETGKAIGSVGLHDDKLREFPEARMLGYVLSEEYWGKGIMTEAVKAVLAHAFLERSLLIVSVFHYPFNQRSRRVIEKCGFTYEGTMRIAAKIYDGTIYDACCYSMTREEYLARQK